MLIPDLPALLNGDHRHLRNLTRQGIHSTEDLLGVMKLDPKGWFKTGVGAVTAAFVKAQLAEHGIGQENPETVALSPEEAKRWGFVSRRLKAGEDLTGLSPAERVRVYAALGALGGRQELIRLLRVPNPPRDLGERFTAAYRHAERVGVAA